MFTVTSVEGNKQKLDGGSMFGNAPKVLWEKWLPPDHLGRITLNCRCLLIEVENKKIHLETGIGCFFAPELAKRFGVEDHTQHILLKNLEKINVSHTEIDFVVLSHLHFDHCGGLLPSYAEQEKGNHQLLFPKAKYIVGKEAFNRCQFPHRRDKASFIPGLWQKLLDSNRLIILDSESTNELYAENIKFFTSDGHTPGQIHLCLEGQNRTIFFCGDLIPGTSWLNPSISMGYDRYPELLINEKIEILELASKHNWILFFTHDPQVSAVSCTFDEHKKIKILESYNVLESFKL